MIRSYCKSSLTSDSEIREELLFRLRVKDKSQVRSSIFFYYQKDLRNHHHEYAVNDESTILASKEIPRFDNPETRHCFSFREENGPRRLGPDLSSKSHHTISIVVIASIALPVQTSFPLSLFPTLSNSPTTLVSGNINSNDICQPITFKFGDRVIHTLFRVQDITFGTTVAAAVHSTADSKDGS